MGDSLLFSRFLRKNRRFYRGFMVSKKPRRYGENVNIVNVWQC